MVTFNKIGLLLIFSFLLAKTAIAQQEYILNIPQSSIIISGTSNFHDWSMKAGNLESRGIFFKDPAGITKIEDLIFSCRVKNIKSGNSIMDSKTYNALKEEKNPTLIFKLISLEELQNINNSFTGKAKGELTVAGVKKIVWVPFTGNFVSNNVIKVIGKFPLKMSDFKVEKPTFMLGAFKTGDNVEIEYVLEYKKP